MASCSIFSNHLDEAGMGANTLDSPLGIGIIIAFFATLIVIFWIWLSVVVWTLKNGISPMPTSEKVKGKVIASIPPETQGIILDLGSGWGNIAIHIGKLFPHCQVIGYETSPIPYYASRLWAFYSRASNVRFLRKNIFDSYLGQANLVYCYLFPAAMKKLSKKFAEELKPGTIVISNTFSLPGWEPLKVLEVKDLYNTRIYVYIKSTSYVDALHAKDDQLHFQSENISLTD